MQKCWKRKKRIRTGRGNVWLHINRYTNIMIVIIQYYVKLEQMIFLFINHVICSVLITNNRSHDWHLTFFLFLGKYTSLCDVWSFGILMWEIFSGGVTPYSGMTNNQAREQIDRGLLFTMLSSHWRIQRGAEGTFAPPKKQKKQQINTKK